MIDYPITLSQSYIMTNKVLNTLVRRQFGKQYSIRLNSLRFFSNRTNVNYHHTCSEKITLKSIKPISFDELISIKDFLVCNVSTALICIDYKSYLEVVDVEITIL
jgi:hypothetical protein